MTGWVSDLHDKAGKATPGPWRQLDRSGAILGPGPGRLDEHIVATSRNDAAFIAACSPERVRALCELAEAAQEYLSAEDEWHLRHGMSHQRVPYRREMDFRNRCLRDKLAALASLEPAREEET